MATSSASTKDASIDIQMLDHPFWPIRLSAYSKFGFTPLAFNDESFNIRFAACIKLGYYPVKTLREEYWRIRYNSFMYHFTNEYTLSWITREKLLEMIANDEHDIIRRMFD